MFQDTLIIEYLGLPGCGKTTLCLSKKTEDADILISSDISAKKANILQLFRSIPWYIIFPIIQFFFSVPFAGKKYMYLYLCLFKREFLNNYIVKYTSHKVVYIDHGMAQSIISLVLCKNIHFTDKALKCAINVIRKSKLSEIKYCKVKPETSLLRIRNRGGKVLGRVEKISDDQLLLMELVKQYVLFEELYIALRNIPNKKVSELDNE